MATLMNFFAQMWSCEVSKRCCENKAMSKQIQANSPERRRAAGGRAQFSMPERNGTGHGA